MTWWSPDEEPYFSFPPFDVSVEVGSPRVWLIDELDEEERSGILHRLKSQINEPSFPDPRLMLVKLPDLTGVEKQHLHRLVGIYERKVQLGPLEDDPERERKQGESIEDYIGRTFNLPSEITEVRIGGPEGVLSMQAALKKGVLEQACENADWILS
jgi:hypothetical protein